MIQGQNVKLIPASLEQAPDRYAWFEDAESCRLYLGYASPTVTYKSVESDILAAMNSSLATGFI